MSNGLAKSTPKLEVAKTPEPSTPATPTTGFSSFEYNNIPIDFYSFFNTPLERATEREIEELKDIYDWSKEGLDEATLGNVMTKVRDLELKLGVPRIDETRRSRLWSWMKCKRIIDEQIKRQKALERY